MRTVDERNADEASVLENAMEATAAEIRVAMPGIIKFFDASTQTVIVQLAIREKVSLSGVAQEIDIPELVDVPLVMPSAGGYDLLMVPQDGDECLVVFADACIDAWWQSGGVQSQADKRRHDLSDGFAILGCWSQPNKRKKFPSSGCALQNRDGTAGIKIDGTTVNIFGSVQINGSSYAAHKHSGVYPGSSNTGGIVGNNS